MNQTTARPPLRLALAHECDLVTRGFHEMLAPYSARVVVTPPERDGEPFRDVDLTLHDPSSGVQEPASVSLLPAHRFAGRMVVYTWNPRPDLVNEFLACGAAGVIAKTVSAPTLVAALEAVHRGEQVVEYGVTTPLRRRAGQDQLLTPREEQVIRLITLGLDNASITRELSLSINSVKSYVRSGYRKMGVTSRSQAVLWGVRHGLLEASPESPHTSTSSEAPVLTG
ncbi:hypothetical protein GCM10009623_36110 [Nocardioides aestuarii]|uniref:DNA-binding response regulator n=1 Tax=Nocardioides aestuarii TaxID=252231 RepID=A0ABW4TTV6_9ACTN